MCKESTAYTQGIKSSQQNLSFEEAHTLDLPDKDFESAIIDMHKELKKQTRV